MIKLGGRVIQIHETNPHEGKLFALSTNANLPTVLRGNKAFIARSKNIPEGFSHYITFESQAENIQFSENSSFIVLPDEYDYLSDEDVVRITPNKEHIRVLFRKNASNNTILITEQCNHYCLMCSQPPKNQDDSHLLQEAFDLIRLIPKNTKEIGFTGGEPTLFGDRFLELLDFTKSYLPETGVHILSNGRSFKDMRFTKKYADINHFDMMVGIPIYSSNPSMHDFIVQSQGALDETLAGILNLKRMNQKVEIRVVLHKQSITDLLDLCEFIGRNLLFVDHVALMGLEMMGFTRANLDSLWIDPFDYKDTLSEAVNILSSYGLTTSVYNHQLCIVNEDILPFYRRSISDWKNEFAPECEGCNKTSSCGGFFSSSLQHRYSDYIKAQ